MFAKCLGGLLLLAASSVALAEAPLVEKYLIDGQLAAGERALAAVLADKPDDHESRFGLGILQMLQAGELLTQRCYKHGAPIAESFVERLLTGEGLPPALKNSEPMSYAELRKLLGELRDQVKKAEATLAAVKDEDIKLRLRVGLVRWDIDGDGAVGEDERAWRVHGAYTLRHEWSGAIYRAGVEDFAIAFDHADLLRLRADCHLVAATCDILLAYEWEPAFAIVAPYVFTDLQDARLPGENFARHDLGRAGLKVWMQLGVDAAAFTHALHLKLQEPKRLTAALENLEQALTLYSESLAALAAEEDNDAEWFAGPKQRPTLAGYSFTAGSLAAAQQTLDQLREVLAGERLLGHWRFKATHGVNVRNYFTKPRDLDVTLLIQGQAVVGDLQPGEHVKLAARTLENLLPELTPGYLVLLRTAWERSGQAWGQAF